MEGGAGQLWSGGYNLLFFCLHWKGVRYDQWQAGCWSEYEYGTDFNTWIFLNALNVSSVKLCMIKVVLFT